MSLPRRLLGLEWGCSPRAAPWRHDSRHCRHPFLPTCHSRRGRCRPTQPSSRPRRTFSSLGSHARERPLSAWLFNRRAGNAHHGSCGAPEPCGIYAGILWACRKDRERACPSKSVTYCTEGSYINSSSWRRPRSPRGRSAPPTRRPPLGMTFSLIVSSNPPRLPPLTAY